MKQSTFPMLAFVLATVAFVSVGAAVQTPDCRDWQACRQLALDAAGRQEYDLFHDLAWRAMSLGPKNDPALMTLLARAQSLSGRPHDALVMLNRLAAMNVTTDAATNDDFAGVRALPGWAELEARLGGKSAPAPTPATGAPPVKEAAASAGKEPAGKTEKPTRPADAGKPAPEPVVSTPPPPAKGARTAKGARKVPEPPPAPVSFSTNGLTSPVGLAYDAVSGRFIIGDRQDRRLLVIGERSGRLASLAGIDAGFHEITAFEIDAVEGDLWVVSTSAQPRSSTVHKLQLISGRVLFSVALPPEDGPARFSDIAVTPQSVLVLDSEGRRVFRLAKKGKALDVVVRLAVPQISSLAPAQEGIAYAPYDAGLLKVDLTTRNLTVVEPGERVDLNGLTWVRWFRGSLVGIQRKAGDSHRLVRIRLDEGGRSVKSLDVLEEGSPVAGPSSAALVGNTLHYLSRAAASDDVTIKKVALK
jgi:hypothetical protein